jgi:hypothetical protein
MPRGDGWARGAPIAVLCAGLVACGPAPLLPSGIAELRLGESARSLARTAASEEASGGIARRSAVLADVHGQLLAAPPPDELVPELFDVLVAVAPRMESGAISPAWASYVYTSYERDLVRERPGGVPRRGAADVERAVQGYVEFYRLRAREGQRAPTLEDAGFQDTIEWRNENRLGR